MAHVGHSPCWLILLLRHRVPVAPYRNGWRNRIGNDVCVQRWIWPPTAPSSSIRGQSVRQRALLAVRWRATCSNGLLRTPSLEFTKRSTLSPSKRAGVSEGLLDDRCQRRSYGSAGRCRFAGNGFPHLIAIAGSCRLDASHALYSFNDRLTATRRIITVLDPTALSSGRRMRG